MKLPFLSRRRDDALDSAQWKTAGERPTASKAVFFVHGLGSTARSTWSHMLKMCLTDPDLESFAFYKYDYPSGKTGFKFWKSLPNLANLSNGLKTEIAIRSKKHSEVYIIAHSMGGLIVRWMIADQIEAGTQSGFPKALLLATPNSGSALAIVAGILVGRNAHTALLAPSSAELKVLNEKWIRLSVDQKADVWFVAGGMDQIVSEPSVRGIKGRRLDQMLIGYDHASITRPDDVQSSNYLLIKTFLTDTHSDTEAGAITAAGGDPLFETYRLDCEPYYIVRQLDATLSSAIHRGHVWLSGASGVGKTAAITRAIRIRNWTVFQIYLGSYLGASPAQLVAGIYSELAERLNVTNMMPENSTVANTIFALRSLFRLLPKDENSVLLVEEIPLATKESYAEFCRYIHMIVESIEACGLDNMRLFITSIIDPNTLIAENGSKFRAKMQLLPLAGWSTPEVDELATRLNEVTELRRPDEEVSAIVLASSGMPRFVKAIFRRWRNGTDGGRGISELVNQTRDEMV